MNNDDVKDHVSNPTFVPKDYDQWCRHRLLMRVSRLKKLMELNGPDVVIANEAAGVVEVILANPKLASGYATRLQRRAAALMGFCTRCGQPMPFGKRADKVDDATVCPTCLDELKINLEDVDDCEEDNA